LRIRSIKQQISHLML